MSKRFYDSGSTEWMQLCDVGAYLAEIDILEKKAGAPIWPSGFNANRAQADLIAMHSEGKIRGVFRHEIEGWTALPAMCDEPGFSIAIDWLNNSIETGFGSSYEVHRDVRFLRAEIVAQYGESKPIAAPLLAEDRLQSPAPIRANKKGSAGRRPGSSLDKSDGILIDKMADLIRSGEATGPTVAAEMLAQKAGGGGTVESKSKRLQRKFIEKYPNWKTEL